MDNFQFGVMEILSTGPLLGFSFYPIDEKNNFSELNIYLILFGLHFRFYNYEYKEIQRNNSWKIIIWSGFNDKSNIR